MVISYLYIVCVGGLPDKTDSVLVINAYRILALAISLQRVQIQPRTGSQIVQRFRGRQERKPAPGEVVQLNRQQAPSGFGIDSGRDVARAAIAIAADRHRTIFALRAKAVNQAVALGGARNFDGLSMIQAPGNYTPTKIRLRRPHLHGRRAVSANQSCR